MKGIFILCLCLVAANAQFFDYADYYNAMLDYAVYDYYDWVCTGNRCQLCDLLTGACCNPQTNQNCFLPDSCANNPCLAGGTCIPTQTVGGQSDFSCVCKKGLTGKYCQLIDEYDPPVVLPVVAPVPGPAPVPVNPIVNPVNPIVNPVNPIVNPVNNLPPSVPPQPISTQPRPVGQMMPNQMNPMMTNQMMPNQMMPNQMNPMMTNQMNQMGRMNMGGRFGRRKRSLRK